ncbi:MAG: PilN domain-containing protein [Gammaproteobacteria bacterium]
MPDMQQEINLYQPLFHKRSIPLSGKAIAQMLLLLLCGIAIVYAYEWTVLASADSGLRHLNHEQAHLTERLATLTREVHAHRKSPLLEARLRQLGRALLEKENALKLLNTRRYGNLRGFSDEIEALSRAIVPGLWFQAIRIRKGGRTLTLKGHALKGSDVPRFLKQLSRTGVSLSIHRLLIRQGPKGKGYLDFMISTAAQGRKVHHR